MNGIQFAFIISLLMNVVVCAVVAADKSIPIPPKVALVTLMLMVMYMLVEAWLTGQLGIISVVG